MTFRLFCFAKNASGALEACINYRERLPDGTSRTLRQEWTGQTFGTWRAAEAWSLAANLSEHAGGRLREAR